MVQAGHKCSKVQLLEMGQAGHKCSSWRCARQVTSVAAGDGSGRSQV